MINNPSWFCFCSHCLEEKLCDLQMFGQIVHCVNDRFCSDMPHAIELISTQRTGIPGLCLIVLSLLFKRQTKHQPYQKGDWTKQCSELRTAFVLCKADRGRNVQIGLCGGGINNPNRIEAFLHTRHVDATV